MKGSVDDPFFGQIRNQLERYKPLHLPITEAVARSYRHQARKRAAARPRPTNPVMPSEVKDWARVASPLATMSWNDFAKSARQDTYHDFKKRMKLLRAIQQMFAKTASFADLPVTEWKGIAGVLGSVEADEAGLADFDWGWFGSMGGAGTFAELIGKQDGALAAALDSVPKRGDVTEAHFTDYVHAFTAAFTGSSRDRAAWPCDPAASDETPRLFRLRQRGQSDQSRRSLGDCSHHDLARQLLGTHHRAASAGSLVQQSSPGRAE